MNQSWTRRYRRHGHGVPGEESVDSPGLMSPPPTTINTNSQGRVAPSDDHQAEAYLAQLQQAGPHR